MKILKFSCVILFFLLCKIGNSQKVEYRPSVYLSPVDKGDELSRSNYTNNILKPPSKKSRKRENWLVISDRSENKIHSSNSTKSEVVYKAAFKEVFYVTENRKGWLKVGKGEVQGGKAVKGEFKEIGWIQKENVLQWISALYHPTKKIHLKGFLLNRASRFDINNLAKAKLYKDPESSESIGELGLHEFYFIYKITYDGNRRKRVLLGDNSKFAKFRPKSLIGWVDYDKLETWETRVALEPNFNEPAFLERKNNKNARVLAVKSAVVASNISSGVFAEVPQNEIFWNGDPVGRDASSLGQTNPRRLKGDVVRFPIFEHSENYYRSGIIAKPPKSKASSVQDIDNVNSSRKKLIRSFRSKSENINILFLLDGTDQDQGKQYAKIVNEVTKRHKAHVLNGTIKVGVAIFKDDKEGEDIWKFKNLTSDLNSVTNFLSNTYWGRKSENDDVVCSLWAMDKALDLADFKIDQTNILVQMGDTPDISTSNYRLRKGQKYKVNTEGLRKKFSELNMHWIIAKTKSEQTARSQNFDDLSRKLMNEFAKEIWLEYENNISSSFGGKISAPLLPQVYETDLIEAKNFWTKFIFKKPPIGKSVFANDLILFCNENLKSISDKAIDEVALAEQIESGSFKKQFEAGVNGSWSPEIIPILQKAISLGKQSNLSDSELKSIMSNINSETFYQQVYFPKRFTESRHNPFSVVLFMPKEDLIDYVNLIETIIEAYHSPKDLRRQKMQEYLEHLARLFSAQELGKGDALDMDIEEIMDLVLGIEDRSSFNLEKKFNLNVSLKDLDNTKKFSESDLEKFMEAVARNFDELENIAYERTPYEFKYRTEENTYYWLPVDLMY